MTEVTTWFALAESGYETAHGTNDGATTLCGDKVKLQDRQCRFDPAKIGACPLCRVTHLRAATKTFDDPRQSGPRHTIPTDWIEHWKQNEISDRETSEAVDEWIARHRTLVFVLSQCGPELDFKVLTELATALLTSPTPVGWTNGNWAWYRTDKEWSPRHRLPQS